MQYMDHNLRKNRGSSPPFQELERWIDDGADGAHWVRTPPEGVQPADDRPTELLPGTRGHGMSENTGLTGTVESHASK